MKNILVLTDFSKCANNAARYAIQMSALYDIRLTFYHCTYQYFLTEMSEEYTKKAMAQTEQRMLYLLKQNVEGLYKSQKLSSDKVNYIVHYGTHVTDRLPQIIEQEKIDLIIMGTKGASGFDRILFGSNTVKTIDRAACPVLSIPQGKRFKPFKKMLLFSDFTELKAELQDAIPLAKKLKCAIEIVHMKESILVPEPSVIKMIENLKEKNRFELITVKMVKRDYQKDMVTQIEAIASNLRPDIICMHTLKYNWLEKIFMISYTKDLVYHCKTVILTFSKKKVFEPILI